MRSSVFIWRAGTPSFVCVAACLLLFGVSAANANTVLISVSGGQNPGNFSLCFTCPTPQWLGVSFTLTAAFTNVAITPTLVSGGLSGTAFLTNAIGAGATNTNVLATSNFNLPATAPALTMVPLLNGLNLSPGTYYFLISPTSGAAGWQNLTGATIQTFPGAALGQFYFIASDNSPLNLAFPPGSAWVPNSPSLSPIDITSVSAPPPPRVVPEPSMLILVGIGLSGLTRLRRRFVIR